MTIALCPLEMKKQKLIDLSSVVRDDFGFFLNYLIPDLSTEGAEKSNMWRGEGRKKEKMAAVVKWANALCSSKVPSESPGEPIQMGLLSVPIVT